VIPYSPLAGGFLTGKYRKDKPFPESARAKSHQRDLTDANLAVLAKLDEVAAKHRAKPAQVALAWLLADPVITSPIISATNLEQLKENLGALDVRLGSEDIGALNEVTAWKTKPEK
jgi:aryl-alcohol dehydrogenase-like predicted oxidoreductase